MPKLSQKSFVSGQYDRIAQNQESINNGGIVASGLSYSKNNLSSDKGELRKRLGTKFLKQLDSATVIVPFRMVNGDDAILLCNEQQISGYRYNQDIFSELLVATGDAPTIPTSGWNTNVNGDYTVTCSSDTASSGWGKGFNADDWHQARPYTPKYPLGTQYLVPGRTLSNVPAWIAIETVEPQILSQIAVMWVNTCTGSHRGHYKGWINPVLQYSDDGNTWISVQTGIYQISASKNPGVTQYNWEHDGMTENDTGNLLENLDHVEPHRYWRVYYKDRIINNNTYGSERLEFFCYNIKYMPSQLTPYVDSFDVSNIKDIKYAQNEQTMFMACKNNKPIKLRYENGNFTKSVFTVIDTFGTPTSVEYFQNRLWFGGLSSMPNGVIASKFGAYETFSSQSTIQPDDYLELKCNQLKSQITNIKGGQRVLYCFSEDGISNVDGGGNGYNATSVQSIEFILKNRMPAGNSTPAFKDDVMLYSSSDGTKLYGVDFDLLVNRFQVSDLAKYAKDITKAKITELHYVNNESKLVYGLMEDGSMFALLYEKGQYQGFFPLDFGGTVYDIAPIKVGRNYKLLMVVFRDGNWYLEEKLDMGNYIDTSTPRLTDEEKKWATYDNLENNIALDCYQTYDESFGAEIKVLDETHIGSNIDLSSFIGKTIMLSNDGNKDFVIARVESVKTLYAWDYYYDLTGEIKRYTDFAQPSSGDFVYDKYGVKSDWVVHRDYTPAHDGYPGSIVIKPDVSGSSTIQTVYENPDCNAYIITVTIEAQRGETENFTKAYPEFTEFAPNLPQVADVGVISEGRYFNATKPDENGKIYLPAPCHKVIYGVPYESVAIIKLQAPYESLKNIAQVDLSVIDSTHLEVGTNFDDTQYIEKIDDSSYYDLTRITMNDTYRLVLSDTPETVKNLILRSNKGVPFTVIAIDMYVNYSNLGGD